MQALIKGYFTEFKENWDEKYDKIYGNYRIDRITEVVAESLKCGDFRKGVTRIKVPEPELWT